MSTKTEWYENIIKAAGGTVDDLPDRLESTYLQRIAESIAALGGGGSEAGGTKLYHHHIVASVGFYIINADSTPLTIDTVENASRDCIRAYMYDGTLIIYMSRSGENTYTMTYLGTAGVGNVEVEVPNNPDIVREL